MIAAISPAVLTETPSTPDTVAVLPTFKALTTLFIVKLMVHGLFALNAGYA